MMGGWSSIPLALFDQTFAAQDLAIVGLLIVLEGVLSIDNALVLGLLAKKLPKYLQSKALTYGLIGAFVFRLVAIGTATYLLRWWFVKLIGGAYLIYVAAKNLFFEQEKPPVREAQTSDSGDTGAESAEGNHQPIRKEHLRTFWSSVAVIELTDIAFAIDSILAAIALVAGSKVPEHGFHPKLWVIVTGGFLGVILMRFAAIIFIRLLERFPRFETAAYLLVLVIGCKLLADWWFNKPPEDAGQEWHPPLNFHSPEGITFWVFWALMLLCFSIGFLPRKKTQPHP